MLDAREGEIGSSLARLRTALALRLRERCALVGLVRGKEL